MRRIALKDNNTLRITKDKEYEVAWVNSMDMTGQLLIVVNDTSDNVIMTNRDFKGVTVQP